MPRVGSLGHDMMFRSTTIQVRSCATFAVDGRTYREDLCVIALVNLRQWVISKYTDMSYAFQASNNRIDPSCQFQGA